MVKNFVAQLLQSCGGNLEHLSTSSFSMEYFVNLSHIPLKNLSIIGLVTSGSGRKLDNFWNTIVSIDAKNMMPALREKSMEVLMESRETISTWKWPRIGLTKIMRTLLTTTSGSLH